GNACFRHVLGFLKAGEHGVAGGACAVVEAIVGVGSAGGDHTHFDVVGVGFVVNRLGETHLREFGGAVDRLVGEAVQPGDGTDEDHPAFLALDHRRGEGFGTQPRRAQVLGDNPVV